jgi:hypothetical protein
VEFADIEVLWSLLLQDDAGDTPREGESDILHHEFLHGTLN